MKKIERFNQISTDTMFHVFVRVEDLDKLEQQRDEAVKALIKLISDKRQEVYRRCLLNGCNPEITFKKEIKPYTDIIENLTGQSWEEIKAGKNE